MTADPVAELAADVFALSLTAVIAGRLARFDLRGRWRDDDGSPEGMIGLGLAGDAEPLLRAWFFADDDALNVATVHEDEATELAAIGKAFDADPDAVLAEALYLLAEMIATAWAERDEAELAPTTPADRPLATVH